MAAWALSCLIGSGAALAETPAALPPPPGWLRPVRAFGPSPPPLTGPVHDDAGQPTLVVRQSVACLVTGGVASLAAIAAGAENLVNVVGGGQVIAANTHVLSLATLGVTFITFCSVGAALTPLYEHLAAPAVPPAALAPHILAPSPPSMMVDPRRAHPPLRG